MADDAGALLVRSGLVSTNALDDARARVQSQGGTVGEQLIVGGAISDDALTEFYRTRLLVPQVNPNMLARLTPKVVATLPSDMAIELRAIPVSLDGDNNLTVAMSDPSDRHAVDEIAFFTGAYVVRAVATQMQIAWCLAHYYGHVTALGQRLLHLAESAPPTKPRVVAPRQPRAKGLTGQVDAARHRAIAPITGPVDVIRPQSGALDLRPLAAAVAPPVDVRPTPSGPPAGPRAARVTPGVASVVAASRGGSPSRSSAETRPLSPVAGGRPTTPPAGVSAGMAPRLTPLSAPPPVASGVPRAATTTITQPIAGPVRPPAGAAPLISPPRATAVSAPPPMAPMAPMAPAAPRALATSTPAPPRAHGSTPAPPRAHGSTPAPRPRVASPAPSASGSAPGLGVSPPAADASTSGFVPRADPDATTLPPVNNVEPAHADQPAIDGAPGPVAIDAAPDRQRPRSVSGEIRLPSRRAASIRPPLPPDPEPDGDDGDDGDDDEPLIVIERSAADDDATGPSRLPPPPRRRAVKSDPPELYARAGEVDLKTGHDRAIDADEPRIVIDEDALAPQTGRFDLRRAVPPSTVMEVLDDADTGALIHDRVVEREPTPVLVELPRTMTDQLRAVAAATLATIERDSRTDDDEDTGETDIVMLDASKLKVRPERRTQPGAPPAPGAGRNHRDTEASGVPTMVDHRDGDRTHRTRELDDPTSIDLPAAPPGDETTSDRLAPPPAPARADDTNPHVIAPPPPPVVRAPIQRAVLLEDDDPDEEEDDADEADDDLDDEPISPPTSVMSSAQLDAAVPQRTVEILPGHLARRHVDYDPVDDGWGPPGTTIPPPLLGAIPGSDDEDDDGPAAPNVIPMPNVDSSPLLVGPPSRPSQGDSAVRDLVRALEEATARAIEVIRQLERAQSRDEVVSVMVAHLAETHHRAGFFVTRQGGAKGATELGLFSMTPRPAVLPFANLRLDRPSTLQDVVGTRLPYRGPMHDDDSRSFLISILGACPAEILLVPVTVRERVVGVLFGEHRVRHTFDDQLALAARAAGMALERILKAKRS